MLRSRLAAVAAASLIGLGLGFATPAMADGSTQTAPTVTQTSPGMFTVDLPGVGSLTFNVGSNGAISNVLATPEAGFTAGSPSVTSEGVQVAFSGANGAVQVLQVEVDHEDGTVKVTAESDQPDQQAETEGDNSTASSTTPTAEAEHEDTNPSTTSTTEAQGEDNNTSATPSTETENEDSTTTTTMGSTTQSSDSNSSDGGTSNDGASSDGGSSDGGSSGS